VPVVADESRLTERSLLVGHIARGVRRRVVNGCQSPHNDIPLKQCFRWTSLREHRKAATPRRSRQFSTRLRWLCDRCAANVQVSSYGQLEVSLNAKTNGRSLQWSVRWSCSIIVFSFGAAITQGSDLMMLADTLQVDSKLLATIPPAGSKLGHIALGI
jgi:hypothetical protein